MLRLAVAAALASTACGTTDDERPETLEYVNVAILAPSCGVAQCHSSFRRADEYVFDTVEATRETLDTYSLVIPGEAESSLLFLVLISPGGDPEDGALPRMPFDRPIPNADIDLIRRWIDGGAEGL